MSEKLKTQIIRRSRKIVRECNQAIADVSSWNDRLPEYAEPFDVSEFERLRDAAQSVLDQLDALEAE